MKSHVTYKSIRLCLYEYAHNPDHIQPVSLGGPSAFLFIHEKKIGCYFERQSNALRFSLFQITQQSGDVLLATIITAPTSAM